MAVYRTYLRQSDARIEGLLADFSGLENLEKSVNSALENLRADASTQFNLRLVKSGAMPKEVFDGWFSELIRKELGKVLGIMRVRAVQKASSVGAGSASVAVLRRTYRGEFAGNINIASSRGRISSRRRIVPEPTGGKSGIRRERTVKARTKQLREYYGPDRGFILRILEEGRDVYMATSDGPTGRGSKATWGARGAMSPRSFFHGMSSDMEQAAQQLGQTLKGYVEEMIEKEFKEGE